MTDYLIKKYIDEQQKGHWEDNGKTFVPDKPCKHEWIKGQSECSKCGKSRVTYTQPTHPDLCYLAQADSWTDNVEKFNKLIDVCKDLRERVERLEK